MHRLICLNFPVETIRQFIFGNIKIVVHLQTKPELGGHVKKFCQAQRRISCYAALTVNDFINPSGRYPDIERQSILTEIHRF